MKALNLITLLLVVIGGLNWGLVAIGGHSMDLVANLFGGADATVARIIYGLVGLSAIWQIMPFVKAFRMDEAAAESDMHHHAT
jgi:hypothetical protein